MTVKEMIEELRGMPQDAEFVLNVAWRDAGSVTVHEETWAGGDFSVWHNRGHGGVPPRVEASVTEDLGEGGMPGCPKCEETARRLRELAGG